MGLFGFFRKKRPGKNAEKPWRLPRWQINSRAQVRWDGRDDYVDCEIKDMNMRGFLIVLLPEFDKNQGKLTLLFPGEFIFNLEVSIAWHKVEGGRNIYGVNFTRIRDADKEKFYQMVVKNFPEQVERQVKGP